MSTVNGFQVGSETLKYNYESLENYNTPEFSTTKTYAVGDYVIYQGKLYKCTTAVTTAGSWNSSNWALAVLSDDVSSLKNAIDELNRQINDETTGLDTKAPVILETTSGAIASFSDGADSMPIKSLVANIEPVQDLHGYDAPWPGGGGKNLFENTAVSSTNNGVTFTVNSDGTVTCSGTSTGTAVLNMVDPNGINQLTDSLILSGCPDGGDIDNTYGLIATTIEGTRLYADSGAGVTMVNYTTFAKLQIVIRSGVNANDLVFKPMIRLASVTDDTFAPYSNECPISGHTGLTVARTGKNLYDQSILERSNITYENGVLTGTAGAFNSNFGQAIPDPPKFKDGQYTFSMEAYTDGDVSTVGFGLVISFKYIDGTYSMANFNNSDSQFIKKEITSTLNKQIVSVSIGYNSVGTNTWHVRNIQLEYSSASTEYEPYTGTTIPITFPTTIYGGSDEVIGGALESTMGFADLGDLVWEESGGTGDYHKFFYTNSLQNNCTGNGSYNNPPTNILCSEYKNGSRQDVYFISAGKDFVIGCEPVGTIYLYDSTKEDLTAAEFKNAAQGIQLVYQLRTPVEYTLTANELNTLYGQNNVWTDVGEVSVDYPADTKLYIDNKIATAVANTLNA